MAGEANPNAFAVGRLSERLGQGFYTYAAALQVAQHPRVMSLRPEIVPGQAVPVSYVKRKDGTSHVFDFVHFLDRARTDPDIADDLARVWALGSLLRVGDALQRHDYFDHAPELELLYHLRNAVAHGNVFNYTESGLRRLEKYPAHNQLAWVRGDNKTVFEISPLLNGQQLLFGFIGPADVVDLFLSVGLYLIRMGNGDPLRA